MSELRLTRGQLQVALGPNHDVIVQFEKLIRQASVLTPDQIDLLFSLLNRLPPGSDANNGQDGDPGVPGMNGRDGLDGLNGIPGMDGADGESQFIPPPYNVATGDVVGPAGATSGNVALFDGATGKLIKDGGTLPTFGTMATQNANNVAITGGNVIIGAGTGAIMEAYAGGTTPSANNLYLAANGNYFVVTGNTQINLLQKSDWAAGAVVCIRFTSNPTVKNNQAVSGDYKPINLAGAADFVASANDVLTLRYDSIDSAWYEVARSIN
jgi:hypothetical protein